VTSKTGFVLSLSALIVCFFLYQVAFSNAPKYTTWEGLEPDKWASVWLIKKHLSPNSEIEIRPIHSRTDDGVAFDVPGADYYRDSKRSTYSSLLNNVDSQGVLDVETLEKIGQIIHDMDVNVWADKALPETAPLENAIRTLQLHFNREFVPPHCYVDLFDYVYETIEAGSRLIETTMHNIVVACKPSGEDIAIRRNANTVAEVPVKEVLRLMGEGKKVVFVDTREIEEYEQMRIPGALNIKLREVNKDILPQLSDADLVISYCVKDFRGYEVARAIKSLGKEESAIMLPYGIRGWADLGLPIFKFDEVSEQDAANRLASCAAEPNKCLASSL